MKKYLLILCVFSISLSGIKAQKPNSSDEEKIHGAVLGVFDGLATLSIATVKSFCTPTCIILESGKIWNLDTIDLKMKSLPAKPGLYTRVNHLDFLDSKINGDCAWIYYANQAVITMGGKTSVVRWLESAFLKKEKNEWKIQLLHSTELDRIFR